MGHPSTGQTAKPLVIAHRGASAVAPQNTMAAFRKAVELKSDGIELDIHLSADGIPVVIHEAIVDATTNGHGRVAELIIAQLQELDAGSSFDPAFAGERIPTLEQVLQAFPNVLLNVELKCFSPFDRGLERTVISLVKELGRQQHVLFSSFNPLSLRRAWRIAPDIRIGLLLAPNLPLPLRRAWLASLCPHQARHPHHTMVTPDYMAWAKKRGYQVNPWTVDDPDEMRRLISLGVHGIITNVPDVLRRVLDTSMHG